jgi:NADH dehydrogenase (ubiquinone) 1 beta subcomplex subunit 7
MWRKNCHHEVHAYNKCEYKEFKRRVAIAIEEKRRRGILKV